MDVTKDCLKEKVFPYVSYRGRFYPIIPVAIEGRERTVVYALVDSGATISIFPYFISKVCWSPMANAMSILMVGTRPRTIDAVAS